jgi:hypothetical protein
VQKRCGDVLVQLLREGSVGVRHKSYRWYMVLLNVCQFGEVPFLIGGLDPPIAGFTSIRTLRSASSASMISPASIKDGLASAYFHDAGTAVGLGWGGTILLICVQSGAKFWGRREFRNDFSSLVLTCSIYVDDILQVY